MLAGWRARAPPPSLRARPEIAACREYRDGLCTRYSDDMTDSEFSLGSLRTTAADIRQLNIRLAELGALRHAQILYLYDDGRGRSGRELAVASELTEGRVYQVLRAGRGAQEGTFAGRPFLGRVGHGDLASGVVLDEDADGFTLEEL